MQQLVIARGVLKEFHESERLELPKDTPEAAQVFRSEILVRFGDCDPAGIVYYPRYMEMFNNMVEDWCREGLHLGLPGFIGRGWGLPAVHLNVDFVAPSKLGEILSASLSLHRLGKSSIHLEILIQGPGASDRVRGKLVLVMTDLRTGHAQAIPGELRESLSKYHLAVHTKEPDAHTGATSGQRSGERH